MTLHSAKGLEYTDLYLTGMEDGIFPHSRSSSDPGEMEEERRLCYVGITRAMERLTLSHAQTRQLWGSTSYNPPSRFLNDIPAELIIPKGLVNGYDASYSRDFGTPNGSRAQARREDLADRAFTAGKRAKQFAEHLPKDEWQVGQDVVHSRWGEGIITDLAGDGYDTEAVINFPSVGEKRILVHFVPLTKK